jgi:O-antigen/teichoic acid export membrane protein
VRRRWLQIAHTSGAGLAVAVASAGSLAITARGLGAEGRGAMAAATTWAALFAAFGSLSLGPTVVHFAAGRRREDWLPEVAGSLLLLVGGLSVACFAVAAGAFWLTSGGLFGNVSAAYLALACLALPFLLAADHGRYLLYALDEIAAANRAQVAGAIFGVLAAALLVTVLRLGVPGALIAVVLGAAVTAVLCWWPVRRPLRFSARTARALFASGLKLHANAVGTFLFQQAGILVVNRYRPADEVAFYQLAVQLFLLALVLPNAVGTTAYAQVGAEGPDAAWPAQRRLLVQSAALSAVAGVLGYLLAPLAIRLVAGDRFLPAAGYFRLLVPALVPAAAAGVLGSQWLSRGLFWQTAALTCAVGAFALALSAILVPRFGATGAAWATLGAYGASALASLVFYGWVERTTAARSS